MQFIPQARLVDFGVRFLTAKGVPAANARHLAEVAVETEAFGISTHGVAMFGYFNAQIGKAIDPAAEPVVTKEKGASALIDGNGAFGQLAMKLAAEIGAKKAREHGVAMVAVGRSFWIGALSVYLIPLARQGLLVQAWAQTSTCKDCAPLGGIDATFSTNPVALAFPTGGEDPMVADFSTAAMSMGKLNQMVRRGEKSDPPLFRDKDGILSDDPAVVRQGGSILFMGGEKLGHKGYALSLWCEALTAVSGGDCNNPEAESRQSFNLTLIDPDAFAGRDYYATEIRRFIAHVKASRPLPGGVIRLPGERGFQSRRAAEREGIPLDESMIEKLEGIARDAGVAGVLAG